MESEEPRAAPVIVFLHGGAFVVGSCESALYGPQVLLDRDLVLVGVNYRCEQLTWHTITSANTMTRCAKLSLTRAGSGPWASSV